MYRQLVAREECFVALFAPITLVGCCCLIAVSSSRMFGQIREWHKRCSTFIAHTRFVCSMRLHVLDQFWLTVECHHALIKVADKLVTGVLLLNFIFFIMTCMLMSPKVTCDNNKGTFDSLAGLWYWSTFPEYGRSPRQRPPREIEVKPIFISHFFPLVDISLLLLL